MNIGIRIDADQITDTCDLARCFEYIIEHTQRTIPKEKILDIFKETLSYHM